MSPAPGYQAGSLTTKTWKFWHAASGFAGSTLYLEHGAFSFHLCLVPANKPPPNLPVQHHLQAKHSFGSPVRLSLLQN